MGSSRLVWTIMEEGLLGLAEDKLDSKDNMSRVEMKLTVKDVEREKEDG